MTARRKGLRAVALRHPAQYIVVTFFAASAVGTLLLMLPIATQSGRAAPTSTAMFTSTSPTCVTGLAVVDTPAYRVPTPTPPSTPC